MIKGQQLNEPVWTDEDYRKNELESWNAAIEVAALIAERSETNITKLIAEDVRGLKKERPGEKAYAKRMIDW